VNAVISDRKVVDPDYVAGLEFEFSGVAYPTWTVTSGCGTPTYAVTAGRHVITTGACAVTLQRSEAVVAGKTYTFSVELDRTNFASFDVVLEFSTTIGGTYTPVASFTNVANGQISHTYYAATAGYVRYSFKKFSTNAGTFSMDNLRFGRVNTQYLAVVKMKADYYPFGMTMPGRNTNSADYRYGYNGMEKDPEVKGEGNSYTTEFRQYDPRLGRWLSLDPLMMKYPEISPYVAFNNNPVYFIDPFGLEGGPAKNDVGIGTAIYNQYMPSDKQFDLNIGDDLDEIVVTGKRDSAKGDSKMPGHKMGTGKAISLVVGAAIDNIPGLKAVRWFFSIEESGKGEYKDWRGVNLVSTQGNRTNGEGIKSYRSGRDVNIDLLGASKAGQTGLPDWGVASQRVANILEGLAKTPDIISAAEETKKDFTFTQTITSDEVEVRIYNWQYDKTTGGYSAPYSEALMSEQLLIYTKNAVKVDGKWYMNVNPPNGFEHYPMHVN